MCAFYPGKSLNLDIFFLCYRDIGVLNPLDSPHHMRIDDVVSYREGVTLDRPVKNKDGSFVNVGLRKELKIDKHLKAGVRVTVKLDPHDHGMSFLKTVSDSSFIYSCAISDLTCSR